MSASLNLYAGLLPTSPEARTPLTIDPKELKDVEERMRPGAFSGVGFLKVGTDLLSVFHEDMATLQRLNISCDLLADVLTSIIQQAKEAVTTPTNEKKRSLDSFVGAVVTVGKFTVSGLGIASNGVHKSGFQQCPFTGLKEEPCHIGRTSCTITNTETKESVDVSDLGIALIKEHGCFQNTKYRIDPAKVCRVLEIKPGDCRQTAVKVWSFVCCTMIDEQPEEIAKRNASQAIKINEWVTAYLGLPKEFQDPEGNTGFKETGSYCHVYNPQPFNDDQINSLIKETVNGRVLNHSITNEGVCIFD